MEQRKIEKKIRMRIAVFEAVIKAGFWTDINQNGASDMMSYIFPKSGQMAYYQLLIEQMRVEHMVTK